jgi:hypothetical protein
MPSKDRSKTTAGFFLIPLLSQLWEEKNYCERRNELWARICRSFKETRYRFSAWRAGTKPYLSYWPARLHRLAKSIPRNRCLGSINVYKYGLSSWRPVDLPNRHIHLYLFKLGYDVHALLSSVMYILSGENITAVFTISRRRWDQSWYL